MKERGMLFSGPFVRAILSGAKSQTRRPVDMRRVYFIGGSFEEDDPSQWGYSDEDGCWHVLDQSAPPWYGSGIPHESYRITCPLGEVGDRLYVRETWAGADQMAGSSSDIEPPQTVAYRADESALIFRAADLKPVQACSTQTWSFDKLRWRSSIHMPRWASRLTLEITDVRVQRLQEISETDAIAEGVATPGAVKLMRMVHGGSTDHADARVWFKNAWDSLYAKSAPWSSSPWVWAISFRKVTP